MYSDSVFHLLTGSPAIDIALFGYFPDLDGVQMQLGNGPDMGAYEK
jgi:hypothetical protein